MIRKLSEALRRFGKREDGVASVEFALAFPMVLYLFFFAVELGLIMTKQVMLEFAMDVAMRDLRLGRMENPSSDVLKEDICERAKIISDCRQTIMIEMRPIDTNTWVLPPTPVSCRDREEDIQPVVTYNPGAQNQIMLVRACVIIEPLFPGIGVGARLHLDAQGGYGMAALSAFVNEPS